MAKQTILHMSNSIPNSQIEDDIGNKISSLMNWFTRSGKPRNYVFHCQVPNCSYKGYKRERALVHLLCHEDLRTKVTEMMGDKSKITKSYDLNHENQSPSKKMATKEQGKDPLLTIPA